MARVTQTRGAVAPSETRLTFEARIAGVAVKSAKEGPAYMGGGASGGQLEVRLLVAQPESPRRPAIPYQFQQVVGGGWQPRPEKVAKAKGVDADAQAALLGEVQANYDRAYDHWTAEMQAYGEAAADHRGRTMAYAQLVGMAAVLGSGLVTVVVTPADQDFLPGFGVSLLAAPARVPEPVDALAGEPDGAQ